MNLCRMAGPKLTGLINFTVAAEPEGMKIVGFVCAIAGMEIKPKRDRDVELLVVAQTKESLILSYVDTQRHRCCCIFLTGLLDSQCFVCRPISERPGLHTV